MKKNAQFVHIIMKIFNIDYYVLLYTVAHTFVLSCCMLSTFHVSSRIVANMSESSLLLSTVLQFGPEVQFIPVQSTSHVKWGDAVVLFICVVCVICVLTLCHVVLILNSNSRISPKRAGWSLSCTLCYLLWCTWSLWLYNKKVSIYLSLSQ